MNPTILVPDGSKKSEAYGAGFLPSVVQCSIAVGKFARNFDGEIAAFRETAERAGARVPRDAPVSITHASWTRIEASSNRYSVK
ncbi:hypothetical protein CEXT_38421 [Caerostris extrusa]|uniref:Uncharacterized protein n=1 Tax=Caerostris extrusa TaxID=172846 RepID=A0AAV4TWH0_CAEEX|nr:hypothetical protein CEXT_38421 [Caerostris extrusa]